MANPTCSQDGCNRAVLARGLCSRDYARWYRNRDSTLFAPPVKGGKMAKFWAKVDKGAADECWPWTGKLVWDGYPRFKSTYEGEPFVRAHRFAYRVLVGPIPQGYTIDHTCHGEDCKLTVDCPHRRCVNPGHLRAATNQANILRGNTRAAANARKTHCPDGHPLSGENLYVGPRRGRLCRACKEAKHKRRNQALTAERRRRADPCKLQPVIFPDL